jgi:hypothetical protein
MASFGEPLRPGADCAPAVESTIETAKTAERLRLRITGNSFGWDRSRGVQVLRLALRILVFAWFFGSCLEILRG